MPVGSVILFKSMVKRVALLTDHADPLAPIGGVEAGGENVYVLELSRSLAKLGWTIDVYTRQSSKKTTQIAKIAPNARVIRLKAGPIEYVPRDQLFQYMPEYVENFLKFVNENKLEYLLIHGNYYFSGWAGLQIGRRIGLPVVNTFHTLGIVRHMALGSKDNSPDARVRLETEIMNGDDKIIATSPPMKDEIMKLYQIPAKKIVIVPGGVNLNRFQPTPQLLARRVLQLSPNRIIVLYVGRIERRKGLDTLLSTMNELAKRMPEKRKIMRLYIAGGEPRRNKTKKSGFIEAKEWERLNGIIDKLGIKDMVRFTGGINRELLTYYYSAADVTAVPSYYEPFGLVPLESMASGTPVVASKVGGMQWTIKDGKTGYLCKPQDPMAFADKIYNLFKHSSIHKHMRENDIERAKFFSWDSVAEQMSQVYVNTIIEYFYRKEFPRENGKLVATAISNYVPSIQSTSELNN
jgi:D-inositol-3-phosphate glycosyltransferase